MLDDLEVLLSFLSTFAYFISSILEAIFAEMANFVFVV